MRPLRLLPVLALSVFACDEGFGEIFSGDGTSEVGGLEARFNATSTTPQFLDVPFPSDVYMASGRFAAIPGLDRLFKRNSKLLDGQLQKTNGWSRIAPVLFPIDDTAETFGEDGEKLTVVVDQDSLPANEDACKADASSIFLIDLDAGTRIACRGIVTNGSEDGTRSFLAVGPARGIVLEEGHKYAAVVTSRVKAGGGKSVRASEAFKAAARGEGPVGSVYGPAHTKVMASIGGALGSDEIIALSPYTTQSYTSELYALRDTLEAAPAPALSFDSAAVAPMTPARFSSVTPLPAGFTASLDDWLGVFTGGVPFANGSNDTDETLPVRAHDRILTIGTGVFEAVNYLQVKAGSYDDVDHATFARDASGKPIPAPEKATAKIWVTFAVPTGTMPPSGWPVVIIQHGLSGSRDHLLSFANRFCAEGWMAVAIDSVTFGARANKVEYQVDTNSQWGKTYGGPDGIADFVTLSGQSAPSRAGSTDLFGALKNVRALADQIRQSALDTASLVKLLRSNPNLAYLNSGSGAPVIDPGKIVYVGTSLGGIEGAVAAAIEPRVKAWMLNVAGAGLLTELAAHGPQIHANLVLAGGANFGLSSKQYTEGHPLAVIGQTLAEAGDPIAYAKNIVTTPQPLAGSATTSRNVFHTEVLFDEVVSNESSEALARAGGWGLAAPNVGANSGIADLVTKTPYRGGGIVLPDVAANAGAYKDTPKAGVTAVLVQVSPGSHGASLTSSQGGRTFEIPYSTPAGRLNLESGALKGVPCGHRAQQDAIARFFSEALAGTTPSISGLPAAVRDADGDGAPDETDTSPIDKAAQ